MQPLSANEVTSRDGTLWGFLLIETKAEFLSANGLKDGFCISLAVKFRLPGRHLPFVMKITARDLRQVASEDLIKEFRSARDFPGVKFRSKFFAVIPEMISLFFEFARGYRMRRNRHSPESPDASRQSCRVPFRVQPLREPKPEHVGRAMIGKRILREFHPRNDDHPVLFPGSFRFRFENLLINREGRFGQSAIEVGCRSPQHASPFAQVIRNGDGAEVAPPIKIDELRNGMLSVAETGVNVKVSQKWSSHASSMNRFRESVGQAPV